MIALASQPLRRDHSGGRCIASIEEKPGMQAGLAAEAAFHCHSQQGWLGFHGRDR